MSNEDKDRAKQQARAQLDSIVDMVRELRRTMAAEASPENDRAQDAAQDRIQEDPLSVEVRGGWYSIGDEDDGPVEFKILLRTGGPAVRIIGELDENREPDRARLEYQDWGTPWTPYREATEEESEMLLEYCRQFYYGD